MLHANYISIKLESEVEECKNFRKKKIVIQGTNSKVVSLIISFDLKKKKKSLQIAHERQWQKYWDVVRVGFLEDIEPELTHYVGEKEKERAGLSQAGRMR